MDHIEEVLDLVGRSLVAAPGVHRLGVALRMHLLELWVVSGTAIVWDTATS